MGLFNYKEAYDKYSNDERMQEIIECYKDLDEYHLLRNGSRASADNIKKYLPDSADDYKKWVEICDGGLLFSTTLLGGTGCDNELELEFSTIEEANAPENIKEYALPEGYVIIAVYNYGALVCLSDKDSKVHLWEPEEEKFTTVWESFADYLADEYNTAVSMIEDNALMPVPLKCAEA